MGVARRGRTLHGRHADDGVAHEGRRESRLRRRGRSARRRADIEAFARAHELSVERSLTFVHPFDDDAIMAGQGTVGLEILDAARRVSTTSSSRSAAAD